VILATITDVRKGLASFEARSHWHPIKQTVGMTQGKHIRQALSVQKLIPDLALQSKQKPLIFVARAPTRASRERDSNRDANLIWVSTFWSVVLVKSSNAKSI
jgi:hypothetical protein